MNSTLSLSISTTRTSVADRSRGLRRCQLSRTPRRIRSPAAMVSRTAISVDASHVTTTRRAGRLNSDADFEAVIGADYVERRAFAGQLLIANTLFVHPLDSLVVVGRLMVKQGKDLGLCLVTQINGDEVAWMTCV